MQNQRWTGCSDTISTTADNKSVSSQAKRSDHDITFSSPLQLSLESYKDTDELVCVTFPSLCILSKNVRSSRSSFVMSPPSLFTHTGQYTTTFK